MNKVILISGLHLMPPDMFRQLSGVADAAGYELAPAPMHYPTPEDERRFPGVSSPAPLPLSSGVRSRSPLSTSGRGQHINKFVIDSQTRRAHSPPHITTTMKLTKTEIATLKWLLKQGQEMQAMALAGPDVRLGHSEDIIKRLTTTPRKKVQP